ncbi:flagellar M-ring protein FliF [Abyssibius alkaniclasticus]|uniref:flagellar basal-body MS-ring/collar protein FliF n=1 Tax=Abyssibius alkaniclasticus TaxID=2881234 RepID=UPI0023648106|nr:flagellar basal-body MS-ring/collar protein FliF [Abyssibius alkaniclasticus]UPH71811.1 flagellar M-ring protein FliF [Abyssibius alkaniclasticus]
MTQILTLWNAIEPQKRLVAILAAIAVLVALYGLTQVAGRSTNALLYAGLEPADAGQVVAALEAQGVAFEVQGDSIYVPAGLRDQVRMSLAATGLPSNGAAGYELLDTLSGFSTTAQMFDAAYWRAKEGELARTIVASSLIRAARVHIAAPSQQPFARGGTPTASVTVTTTSGPLGNAQAEAVRYLVASAVAGLDPSSVALIDSTRGLIAAGAASSTTSAGELDPRAAAMRANVERLLAARVGPGNAIVELTIDTITAQETVTERLLNPEARIAVSQETETRSESSSDAAGAGGGAVTVASNLPATGATGTGTASSNRSDSRETINYDTSETLRETLRPAGEIRRLSVAVLVNDLGQASADGAITYTPRPAEELDALRGLVQSAVGFDAARGDVVTIAAMPFSTPEAVGSFAQSAGFMGLLAANLLTIIQLAVLALVILALAIFVVRPVLARPAPAAIAPMRPAAEPGDMAQLPASPAAPAALEDHSSPDPLEQLRNAMNERAEDSTRLLRSWIETPEGSSESAA